MFDYQLELASPYDISIKEIDKNNISEYINFIQSDYTIEESFSYHGYKETNRYISNSLGEYSGWRDYDQVIKLSDYNKLLELRGDKKVSLADDEYLINTVKELGDKIANEDSIKTLTLSNGVKLKQKEVLTTGYTYSWGVGYGFIIVVPDNAITGLEEGATNLIVNTKEKTTETFGKKLTAFISPDICNETEDGYTMCYSSGNLTVRGQEEATNNGFITIISFVCFYIAFIFIAVVGTILAIQSLSDSTKYQYRYRVLSKLGVRDEMLNKTIFKQLFVFFIFPVFYPLIISFVTLTSLNKVFNIALTTNTVYLIYYFINLIVFILIYSIYFIATYYGFKRNIERN